MIFVTVGNATQRFHRLLKAVDELSAKGFFESQKVFVQVGYNTDISLLHCEHKPFLTLDEFEGYMQGAELLISHGGCGTLIHASRLGKLPVVMPRRKKYGEYVNDHQMQLVNELTSQGRIVPAYEPENLAGAVLEARKRNSESLPPPPSQMIDLVSQAVRELLLR